jgi:hypothetical protein
MAPPRSAIVPEVVIFVFSAAAGGEFAPANSSASVFRRESRTIADFGKYVLVVHYLDAVSDGFQLPHQDWEIRMASPPGRNSVRTFIRTSIFS